jgi:hypothetical protein
VENVLVRAKDLASGANLDTALDDNGVARLYVLQNHGQSTDQMAQINGVISLEKSRDRDEVGCGSVQVGLVVGESDIGHVTKDRLQLCETLDRDVEANGLVAGTKGSEKMLADIANSNNADHMVMVSEGTDRC